MICLLICTHNPSKYLLEIIRNFKDRKFKILIVDDGSKYNKIILKEATKFKNVIILRNSKNRGKGWSLKKGFTFIKNKMKANKIVTVDGDGQHLIKDVKKLIQVSYKNKYKILIKNSQDQKEFIRIYEINKKIKEYLSDGYNIFTDYIYIDYILTKDEFKKYKNNYCIYFNVENFNHCSIKFKKDDIYFPIYKSIINEKKLEEIFTMNKKYVFYKNLN